MGLKAPTEQIKAFWDGRADSFGVSGSATLPERAMHALEIKAIAQQLGDGLRVADIGCGNGFATLRFARQFRSEFCGFDYSERMIHYARQAQAALPATSLRGRLNFGVADLLHLPFASQSFDRVVTERCVQNLPSHSLQTDAMAELLRIAKPGGMVVMAECSQAGVEQMNRWRRRIGRVALTDVVPWHNFFLDDSAVLGLRQAGLPVQSIAVRHYSSTYAFVTRVLPFWRFFYYRERLATLLPNIGSFGYFKLYLLQKAT